MVCEQNAAACLLARALKHCRVVALKAAVAGSSATRLKSQKAKEWARSSRQSHGFHLLHKSACGQKKKYVKRDSKMKKTSKWFIVCLKYMQAKG